MKEEIDTEKLKQVLNSFHPSVQFTIHLEQDKSLPFRVDFDRS